MLVDETSTVEIESPTDTQSLALMTEFGYEVCGERDFHIIDSATGLLVDLPSQSVLLYESNILTFTPPSEGEFAYLVYFSV